MLQDGKDCSHGSPKVVRVQCHGNVDPIVDARVAIAKGRGFPEDRDIRDRLPNHIKVDTFGDNVGGSIDMLEGGGGDNEKEQRQEANDWWWCCVLLPKGHPVLFMLMVQNGGVCTSSSQGR